MGCENICHEMIFFWRKSFHKVAAPSKIIIKRLDNMPINSTSKIKYVECAGLCLCEWTSIDTRGMHRITEQRIQLITVDVFYYRFDKNLNMCYFAKCSLQSWVSSHMFVSYKWQFYFLSPIQLYNLYIFTHFFPSYLKLSMFWRNISECFHNDCTFAEMLRKWLFILKTIFQEKVLLIQMERTKSTKEDLWNISQ